MEMKEGTSLEAHIKHMKEVADQVAAIDFSISEKDQVVTFLGSLPHSYSTIVSALEAQGADNLSLSFVQQALVNEELKLSGDSVCTLTNDQSSSALVHIWKKKFIAKARKPRSCYNCEQIGHYRRDCPKLKKDELINRLNPSHKAETANIQLDSPDADTDNAGAFAASHGTIESLHMEK